MSNIREVEFRAPEVDTDLVEMLERWTERARKGEIVGVGLAGVRPDGGVSTEWFGARRGLLHPLISAAAVLKHRILSLNIDP